jgi:hypothetical protein
MGRATLLCKSMRRLVAIELHVGPSYPFLFDLRKVASFPFTSKRRRPQLLLIGFNPLCFPPPTQSRQCASKGLECYISRYMTALSKTFHSSSAYRCRIADRFSGCRSLFDEPANGDPDAFKLAKYVLTIDDRYRASNVYG